MATRCSTNPPLFLTARYTSIAFQRGSQLSFAVAMIIRSIHFRCSAMPCHSIPFHSNARQRFAFPLLTSAFPYCSLASPFLCPAGLRGTMPLRSSARPFSSARSYSFAILLKSLRPVAFASRLIANPRSALALLCAATLYFAMPLPCPSAQRPADALLNIACLCSSATMLFTSMLFLCCACHRVSPFINTSPFLCCATRSSAPPFLAFAQLFASLLFLCCAPPGTAYPRRCFVRRAYQPAFSSGKKFASCIM